MKWYIGQKVVAVDCGRICTITGIAETMCKCDVLVIYTKEVPSINGWGCPVCGCSGTNLGKARTERAYRPLEDNFAEEVLEKALKEGIKLADEFKINEKV